MKVKRGDIIASEFGQGPIVAITKDWLIHLQEEGEEVCIYKPHNNYWIPVDADEVDIPG